MCAMVANWWLLLCIRIAHEYSAPRYIVLTLCSATVDNMCNLLCVPTSNDRAWLNHTFSTCRRSQDFSFSFIAHIWCAQRNGKLLKCAPTRAKVRTTEHRHLYMTFNNSTVLNVDNRRSSGNLMYAALMRSLSVAIHAIADDVRVRRPTIFHLAEFTSIRIKCFG